MFANLKNKLIEEVKASPSFQQFANAAQAAVSSSSSNTPSSTETNENFFSITEEDTPQNSPYRLQKHPPSKGGRSITPSHNGTGAISRTRKLSNSSMASDISFRLPTYDAPAVYHLQSDLDETSSEFDDSASTARLDVITKDQLYDAYKKSLDRYHKYRCRYTDLAKKYKELERDSTKARSVLVETQEKALRRISELREQCTLEQQAKAHLEEALRVEMDDMSCKMQAYQTKLKLLGENPENISAALERGQGGAADEEQLIDLGEQQQQKSNGTNSNEQQLERLEVELKLMTDKYDEAQTLITKLRKQEEENVLLLAQTKQAIHTELEHKESEVKQLHQKLKQLEADLESTNKREIESTDSKEQLKKLQSAKQETDAKIIATEHQLSQLKLDFAAKEQQVSALEAQLKAVKTDNEQSLQDLRQHNAQLNEMVQRHQQNELAQAETEDQLKLAKQEILTLQAQVADMQQHAVDSEKSFEVERETKAALITEKSALYEQQTRQVEQLKRELQILNEQHANSEGETITALKAELERVSSTLNAEIAELQSTLEGKEKELKTSQNKVNKLKKQHEQHQSKFHDQTAIVEQLNERLQQASQLESEKLELQTRVTAILEEITTMQSHLQQVQQSHAELDQEKRKLEVKIEQLQQANNAQAEATTERAKRAESKLEEVECENTKLAERNCLLAEQSNHLEKQLAEREREREQSQQQQETAQVIELRLQLSTAQDDLSKLQAKMQQILHENSQMQNAQELMDHDQRTLQDKCDAYEKEKLCAEDDLKCARLEIEELLLAKSQLEANLAQLQQSAQFSANELAQFENVRVDLQQQLAALKEAQLDDERHKVLLEEAQKSNVQLQSELAAIGQQLLDFERYPADLERAQNELVELREKRLELEQQLQEQTQNAKQQEESKAGLQAQLNSNRTELETLQETTRVNEETHANQLKVATNDVERLHEANDAIQLELETLKDKYTMQINELKQTLEQREEQMKGQADASQKLAGFEEMQIENEYLNKHVKQLEQQLSEAHQATQVRDGDNNELKEKFKSLQCELYVLQEQAEQHAKELADQQVQSDEAKTSATTLTATMEQQALELVRQGEHTKFITEQNDAVQKELLQAQSQSQQQQTELTQLTEAHANLTQQWETLSGENNRNTETIDTLNKTIDELRAELSAAAAAAGKQQTAASPASSGSSDAEHLRKINEQLHCELADLAFKSNNERADLQDKIDELQSNNSEMADRIMELERLRASIQAQQLMESLAPKTDVASAAVEMDEKAELEAKLKGIMNEVQDVTNRNLFLEQKCENFLILEQSNERLKLQNAKLSRQLDETLISMQHSENVPANTEFEYLRNIMFQYLTGNTNNETLVKVISAVLKFSPQQAQVALEKEHQRRSLLNKLL